VDHVLVRFGLEILKLVPGRVSTEVDARLSFDTAATVARAQQLIALYEAAGIPRERVLIKIAATWEGIRAAEQLERQGIHCNLTLLFAFAQAVACGDAGVQLISPFVGRIYDWHKKAAGSGLGGSRTRRRQRPRRAIGGGHLPPLQAPRHRHRGDGRELSQHGQIIALAGCDLLTIAPDLLAALQASDARWNACWTPTPPAAGPAGTVHHDEKTFRWALNEDAMATEKLAEGIRAFAADAGKLDHIIQGLPMTRCDHTPRPGPR
jgi:transaldolase